jgi:hypothetical protein
MSYRVLLDRKDGGTQTSTETYATNEDARAELVRVLKADYQRHHGTFPDGANYVGGVTVPALDPMREPPEASSLRGSGPVVCCGHHRDRCLFGRVHSWSTWYEDGRLQRTRETLKCFDCGGVCIAAEAPA